MTFILEIKLQNYIFYQNTTVFIANYASILIPCQDRAVHAYVTTEELKRKEFTLKSENMKEAIGIQVTFTLEIKLQKNIFQQKTDPFFSC